MKSFIPNYYFNNVHSIDIALFKKHNTKLVIFDLDNTLASNDVFKPKANVKKLLNTLIQNDIQVAIVSNNNKKRVEKYCKDLSVFNVSLAIKPLKRSFRKIKKHFNLEKNDVIFMVGDQLITDIWYANRNKLISILVNPLKGSADAKITKNTRKLENIIYSKLKKKNILIKEKYGKIK